MPLVVIQSDPRARLRPCLRCGYSLRNVPDARACPECGLAVWLTLSGNDDLDLSNPEWLNRLALGSLTLAATHAALFAAVVALQAWLLITENNGIVFLNWMRYIGFVGGVYFLACGGGLLLLGGVEGRYPERSRGPRRWTIIAGWASIAAGAWFAAPFDRFSTPRFVVLLLAVGQGIAGWMYLAALSRRIPSRRYETFARYFAIALSICFASLILRGTGYMMWVLVFPWSSRVIAWTLFLLAYPALAAALFATFARAFHRASIVARKNWGIEDASLVPSPGTPGEG
jgi:hypothetical protein